MRSHCVCVCVCGGGGGGGGGGGYEKSLWVHVKEYEKSLCVCEWVQVHWGYVV